MHALWSQASLEVCERLVSAANKEYDRLMAERKKQGAEGRKEVLWYRLCACCACGAPRLWG